MRKIRTGVIGCGKVGHFHAQAYQKLPNSEFTAVCNHNIGRAQEFAEQYGVRAFASIREMVEETGVEAVSICTPHPAHASQAVEAARCGLHVMIEKPLASSLEDCDAILAAVREAGVVGSVLCQRRFYPGSQRIRRAIEEGRLGRPILGTVNMLGWRDMDYYHSDPWRGTWKGEGGGVLVNQAVHQLDLLLWMMGEVEEVYGRWDTMNHPGLEVEDTAVAVIRFRSGALGSIVASNSQNPALFGKVCVHGSNGATAGIKTDGGAMFIAGVSSVTEPPLNDVWTVPGEEDMLEQWNREDTALFEAVDATTYFHTLELQDFLDAIGTGRSPQVTLEDGRRAVELFTAIYRSQRDGRPVKFPLRPEYGTDFDGRLAAGPGRCGKGENT